ncbi:MAG: hypothetical protein RIQ78_1625 [Bacteroidota bacterium]|jgi:thioredoxin-related protein
MNLAMRIFSFSCITVLVAAHYAVAQTAPRPNGKVETPNRTVLTPKTGFTGIPSPKSAASETRTVAPAAATSAASRSEGLSPSPTSLRNSAAPPVKAPGASARPIKKVSTVKIVQKITVHWMSLEEAIEKSRSEKRKIFVDVYTDWCGWCKHMDSTTFVQPDVANYLNNHYYPVKFNAEQNQDILFKDKVYRFQKNGSRGYHELAALWLNNRLSFPTVVVLDENQTLIQPVPGYQDADKLEVILQYFGSDSHKRVPWETYEKSFKRQH